MKAELMQWHPYDSEVHSVLPTEERKRFLRLTSAILDEMPDSPEKWAVSLGLGADGCAGMTLEAMAARAGITPQSLLKRAVRWCADQKLMASPHLKTATEGALGARLLVAR